MNDSRKPTTGRSTITRRQMLQSTLAAGTGLTILPSGVFGGPNSPNNKLNIAIVGSWGRARAHFNAIKGENVVALCDVNEKNLAQAAKTFTGAKHYSDWRKCLEQKDIDAVVCSTTDHTHAFIANWAVNRDMHVYCEKPLANTVEEARVVRANWLSKKDRLATQVGTQRHAHSNFDRVREMILDGAVGTLQHVHVWGNRELRRPGYLPAAGDPPSHLNYDLWIGPSAMHPFNPGYFGGCLSWNMYWDFGSGQIGDMGSHTMDLAWYGIDATLPTTAEAFGQEFNPDVTPVDMTATFEHPANSWRPPIKLTWYQGAHGGKRKKMDPYGNGHGALFVGDKAKLVAGFTNNKLLPLKEGGSLDHYTPRSESERIPSMGGFQAQWVNACKGDLKTACDFEYSGDAIEQMLLGLVAYRVGKKISYDSKAGRVTNCDEANELLSRKYRAGWVLDG
ncbi:MAG TPA: Gfo/Idh/MocA family oxidoreductase [Pirellulaceae bacterium]|nr:Gfo/Idh/MocA family oxidoreductase [Pirellulaceae bacterium]